MPLSRPKHRLTLGLIALAAATLPALAHAADPAGEISRGRYLVSISGCADCHTPLKMGPKGPEPDVSRGLSGHPQGLALPPAPAAQGPWVWGGAGTNTAFWGPWGVSYAVNLTPDRDTGLGGWTAEQFVGAMKTGQHRGAGRPIAPPMPWQAYSQMSEADLRAIFQHLMSLPAIGNAVPAYQPPR